MTAIEGLDTMLRLAFPREDQSQGGPGPMAGECKWESTLDLVARTAETLRAAEERIRDLEARQEEVVRITAEQIGAAHARIAAAEMRAQEAEKRADQAEEDGRANQDWLSRVRNGLEHLPASR